MLNFSWRALDRLHALVGRAVRRHRSYSSVGLVGGTTHRVDGAELPIAHRLKDLILQAKGTQVKRIILFGSRARGDARPDSDFDLLVVLHDIRPEQKHAELLTLYRALESAGVAAEPWVMSEEEFEETKSVIGGLAHPAWKEGVVLYENP